MPTAPATASENYEREKAHIRECLQSAKILEDGQNKLLRQREVKIQIEEVNREIIDRCVKMMGVWGWPTNGKKQLWTADPKINGITLNGTWRHVETVKSANERGMYITLREGFAQAISWDEAYIDETDDLQEDERYCAIIFPNVDPEYADTMLVSLSTHTTTGFTVDSKARTGTWEYVHKRSRTVDNDGSMSIVVFAAQPQYTSFVYENRGGVGQTKVWHVDNVPKRLAASVVSEYDTAGTDGSSNYSTQEGLVDLTFRVRDGEAVTITEVKTLDGCQLEEYTSYYYDYTKAQVEAFDLGDAPQGWIYKAPLIRPDGSGARYTIIRVREHAIAVDGGSHTSEKTPISETTTAVKHNQLTISTVGTLVAGTLQRLRARFNKRNCTWDEELDTDTATPLAKTQTVIATSMDSITKRTPKWNQSTLPTLTAKAGFIYQLRATLNRWGWWNYSNDVEEAVAVTKTATRVSASSNGVMTQAENINSATIPTPTVTQGVITKINARLNRFKKWTYTTFQSTSTEWDVEFTIQTRPEITETYINKGNQRTVSMPSRPSGKEQKLSRFTRNGDGTYNWNIRQSTLDAGLGTDVEATPYYTYKFEYDTSDGVQYYRTYQRIYVIKQVATLAEAIAWSASGNITNASRPYAKLGDKEYLGFQITQSVGSWFTVEDGTPR